MNTKILSLIALITIALSSCNNQVADKKGEKLFTAKEVFATPERPAGQKDVIELRTAPIENVRIGFIGLGQRGASAIYRYTKIEGVTISAICDIVPKYVENAQQGITESGLPKADEYTGAEDWKKICERDDIDLIYIVTGWSLHTPIAKYAMEHGKHVVIEVPAATTIKECWDLVDTAEKTQKHCMMLENCNYDFFELTTLNMAQKGLFGEVKHVEGAYIHDLRWLNFAENHDDYQGYVNNWRLDYNANNDGNLYPTHGLGPVCHVLNIHRGDKMDYLVSMSTNQFGLTKYAEEKYGKDSKEAKREYKKGDMNTTIIRTHKGNTILLMHDVASPRPYSRMHTISGTKGFAQKYPLEGISLEPDGHHYLDAAKKDSIMELYKHPITTEYEEKARKVGGHGGMDFIMDSRLIYCLHNGLPLDMDVYDAAEWSSIIELSKKSVENQSMPVQIPDFTRGAWEKKKTVTYYTK
jgi:predicted dehydrogenase